MLRNLLKYGVSYRREMLYQIPHRVRDVVKMQGLKQIPHVVIGGRKIDLPVDTYIGNIRLPNVNSYLRFYDTKFNYFYNSTPVIRVITESFFLQVEDDMYFVINNDPIVKPAASPIYQQTGASSQLEPIVFETLKQLDKNQSIQREDLMNMLVKNVIDRSLQLKMERIMYKALLDIVQKRIATIDEEIKKAEQKLALKAKKRVKWFTNFIIAELAILHYFIYFNLSWDIMEPVTVIIANIDLLVAYWFFILKGKNFTPEGWQKQIFAQKKYRHLLKAGIDIPKYEEYLSIRDYLKVRVGLLSRNPGTFLKTVEQPLKLLNT